MSTNEENLELTEETTETNESGQDYAATFENLSKAFNDTYGMSLTDAQQTYNTNAIKVALSDIWDIGTKKVEQRLAQVNDYLSKLPEAELAKYDSVDGVLTAYEEITQKKSTAGNPPTASGSVFNSLFSGNKLTSGNNQKPANVPLEKIPDPRSNPDALVAYQAKIFEELKAEGYTL